MPLHTLVIDFLKEKFENLTFFFNLYVLYTEIFTLKATDDINILVCVSRDQVLQIYEKNQRLKISCYCPFNDL